MKLVYVLEDDANICEIVTYILSEAGYRVHDCHTVRRFNELMGSKLPDIIILDILLPDGNGLEVCKQLRSDNKTDSIPVLMMSANKTKADIEEVGCKADFIAKPFNIDHFRSRIDRIA